MLLILSGADIYCYISNNYLIIALAVVDGIVCAVATDTFLREKRIKIYDNSICAWAALINT